MQIHVLQTLQALNSCAQCLTGSPKLDHFPQKSVSLLDCFSLVRLAGWLACLLSDRRTAKECVKAADFGRAQPSPMMTSRNLSLGKLTLHAIDLLRHWRLRYLERCGFSPAPQCLTWARCKRWRREEKKHPRHISQLIGRHQYGHTPTIVGGPLCYSGS